MKNNNNNKNKDKNENKLYRNVCDAVTGEPKNCNELLHKYGTYEIQPTAATENEFPKIAQGLPKKEKKSD